MDNKFRILNYLGKHKHELFTMHQLSRELNMPYATFYRTVQKMKGLLKIQNVGKSKTLALNREKDAMKAYLAVSSEEEKEHFLEKQPIIRTIAKELDTSEVVLLFGSYAKGQAREDSDIDLMILNKNGERSISFLKYEVLYSKKINPIFVSFSEFRQMLKEKDENVGKQALKGHIVLNNPYAFWGAVDV